jgi:hypothetical protein
VEFDVGGRDFEILAASSRPFSTIFFRNKEQSTAMRHHRARTDRPPPTNGGPLGSLGLQDDFFGRHSEDFGNNLGKHRLVSLPRGSGEDSAARRPPEAPNLIIAFLLRARAAARRLDEHRTGPMPRNLPFATEIFFLSAKGIPLGKANRLVQLPGRIAAVVGRAGRRLVGERVPRNQVAPAQLDAIDAGLARRFVDQAFDEIGDIRPAGAAIGRRGGGIGEREPVPAVERRYPVGVDRRASRD